MMETRNPANNSCLLDEITLLRETYPGEFSASSNLGTTTLSFLISPGVGFTVSSNKLIDFKIQITCNPEYPATSPNLTIYEVHGLADRDVRRLTILLNELVAERKGDPVLFDIIDFSREFIAKNVPTVNCAICLCGFAQESDVYCTPEFHYFHNTCIGQYMHHREKEHQQELAELREKDPYCKLVPLRLPCPVCRVEELPYSESLVQLAHQKQHL
ncbi:E3 ubiquitin-protein ligase rnf25 [Clonorchis sinensis]|uniref:E3 ubiquitin-protein ligase rnf25 n=2 Tax=Clonorchis sinensis TaxID=79923 RepID=A0A8T1MS34_CLOSI|nr:E3 ubiquitin-protein ligase rnf25 [Clonorchis sinensis]